MYVSMFKKLLLTFLFWVGVLGIVHYWNITISSVFASESTTVSEAFLYTNTDGNVIFTLQANNAQDLYALEIDHSLEASFPEFSVYASGANPYGNTTQQNLFEEQGVSIKYQSLTSGWKWFIDFWPTISTAIKNTPDFKIYYALKNSEQEYLWGNMDPTTSDNTITLSNSPIVAPNLVSATPAGDITLNTDGSFTLTIQATGDLIHALEIDHWYGDYGAYASVDLPEFTVYADELNPYWSEQLKTAFEGQGVTVQYNASATTWTINFAEAIVDQMKHDNINEVEFYIAIHNRAWDKWGSMSPTSPTNTFKYTFKKPQQITDVQVSGNDKNGYVLTIKAKDLNELDGIIFDINPAIATKNSLSLCWSGSNAPYVAHAYCLWYDTGSFLPSIGAPAKQALDDLDITLNATTIDAETVWTINLGKSFVENHRNTTFTLSNIRFFKGNNPETDTIANSTWTGANISIQIPRKKSPSSWWGGGSYTPPSNTTPTTPSTEDKPSELPNESKIKEILSSIETVSSNNELYTDELVQAYTFAKSLDITTMNSIEEARVEDALTRAEFAKMISNYATQVVATKSQTNDACVFDDLDEVNDELASYSIKVCKLGIMGQNTGRNFRPNEALLRSEIVTIISRLYNLAKDSDPYYKDHMAAMKDKWYITVEDPDMTEIRGNVFIILQRIVSDLIK